MFKSREMLLSLWNWLQLRKSCRGLCNPWENLRFWAMIWNNCSEVLKSRYGTQHLPFLNLISLWMPLELFIISLVFSALISILYLVQVLLRFSTWASCSCSSSATASVWLANCRLIISAAYANLSIMFFQSIRHNLFNQNVEEDGWQKTSFPYSDCSEPFFHAVIHLDCTCSLVTELLNGAN